VSQPWVPPRIARVPFAHLAAIIHEVISVGGRVRLQVEGDSMWPWLRHGEDHVILASPQVRLWGRGDVVLVVDDRGRYVMHRVFRRRQGGVWLLGDAQTGEEGPWRDEQIIALVERVERRGRELDMTSPVARLFAWGWLVCRPFRPGLLWIIPWFRRQWQVMQGRR
jgi:hypothetical protein